MADPEFVTLLPGVASACARLRAGGYALVVVTNQGVVARGGATLAEVEATNARLESLLPDPQRTGQSLLDRVYSCPYHPNGSVREFAVEHPWRKPCPGMLLAAEAELGLDLARSWLVGDAGRDIEAGRRAGLDEARLLRVGPGQPWSGLPAAVDHILGHD